ncbi:heme exporter protein CcmD [Pontivivens insulae]|uniref:Heme exporter protein D n=1 Tax=Pontivivens insulae TaxID=1639689 RepID=A0A2R8AE01_9RHOB|nr:heme exporter protein CcmD [Pontivivens insulae]RED14315.1 heme exporter protein D [Pontivivens insulae]SPF30392.1 hypothetical protein POI8812_02728 [Pontivivens insulae]
MEDPYAVYVLSAYGVSLALLGGLIWRSMARARAARRTLDQLEGRK